MLIELLVFALIIALIFWLLSMFPTTPQSAPIILIIKVIIVVVALLYLIGLLTGYAPSFYGGPHHSHTVVVP